MERILLISILVLVSKDWKKEILVLVAEVKKASCQALALKLVANTFPVTRVSDVVKGGRFYLIN